jgi:hypothetical protein
VRVHSLTLVATMAWADSKLYLSVLIREIRGEYDRAFGFWVFGQFDTEGTEAGSAKAEDKEQGDALPSRATHSPVRSGGAANQRCVTSSVSEGGVLGWIELGSAAVTGRIVYRANPLAHARSYYPLGRIRSCIYPC